MDALLLEALISVGEFPPIEAVEIAKKLTANSFTYERLHSLEPNFLIHMGISKPLAVHRILAVKQDAITRSVPSKTIRFVILHSPSDAATEAHLCFQFVQNAFPGSRLIIDSHRYPAGWGSVVSAMDSAEIPIVLISPQFFKTAVNLAELILIWKAKKPVVVVELFRSSLSTKPVLSLEQAAGLMSARGLYSHVDWSRLERCGVKKEDAANTLQWLAKARKCSLHSTNPPLRTKELAEIFSVKNNSTSGENQQFAWEVTEPTTAWSKTAAPIELPRQTTPGSGGAALASAGPPVPQQDFLSSMDQLWSAFLPAESAAPRMSEAQLRSLLSGDPSVGSDFKSNRFHSPSSSSIGSLRNIETTVNSDASSSSPPLLLKTSSSSSSAAASGLNASKAASRVRINPIPSSSVGTVAVPGSNLLVASAGGKAAVSEMPDPSLVAPAGSQTTNPSKASMSSVGVATTTSDVARLAAVSNLPVTLSEDPLRLARSSLSDGGKQSSVVVAKRTALIVPGTETTAVLRSSPSTVQQQQRVAQRSSLEATAITSQDPSGVQQQSEQLIGLRFSSSSPVVASRSSISPPPGVTETSTLTLDATSTNKSAVAIRSSPAPVVAQRSEIVQAKHQTRDSTTPAAVMVARRLLPQIESTNAQPPVVLVAQRSLPPSQVTTSKTVSERAADGDQVLSHASAIPVAKRSLPPVTTTILNVAKPPESLSSSKMEMSITSENEMAVAAASVPGPSIATSSSVDSSNLASQPSAPSANRIHIGEPPVKDLVPPSSAPSANRIPTGEPPMKDSFNLVPPPSAQDVKNPIPIVNPSSIGSASAIPSATSIPTEELPVVMNEEKANPSSIRSASPIPKVNPSSNRSASVTSVSTVALVCSKNRVERPPLPVTSVSSEQVPMSSSEIPALPVSSPIRRTISSPPYLLDTTASGSASELSSAKRTTSSPPSLLDPTITKSPMTNAYAAVAGGSPVRVASPSALLKLKNDEVARGRKERFAREQQQAIEEMMRLGRMRQASNGKMQEDQREREAQATATKSRREKEQPFKTIQPLLPKEQGTKGKEHRGNDRAKERDARLVKEKDARLAKEREVRFAKEEADRLEKESDARLSKAKADRLTKEEKPIAEMKQEGLNQEELRRRLREQQLAEDMRRSELRRIRFEKQLEKNRLLAQQNLAIGESLPAAAAAAASKPRTSSSSPHQQDPDGNVKKKAAVKKQEQTEESIDRVMKESYSNSEGEKINPLKAPQLLEDKKSQSNGVVIPSIHQDQSSAMIVPIKDESITPSVSLVAAAMNETKPHAFIPGSLMIERRPSQRMISVVGEEPSYLKRFKITTEDEPAQAPRKETAIPIQVATEVKSGVSQPIVVAQDGSSTTDGTAASDTGKAILVETTSQATETKDVTAAATTTRKDSMEVSQPISDEVVKGDDVGKEPKEALSIPRGEEPRLDSKSTGEDINGVCETVKPIESAEEGARTVRPEIKEANSIEPTDRSSSSVSTIQTLSFQENDQSQTATIAVQPKEDTRETKSIPESEVMTGAEQKLATLPSDHEGIVKDSLMEIRFRQDHSSFDTQATETSDDALAMPPEATEMSSQLAVEAPTMSQTTNDGAAMSQATETSGDALEVTEMSSQLAAEAPTMSQATESSGDAPIISSEATGASGNASRLSSQGTEASDDDDDEVTVPSNSPRGGDIKTNPMKHDYQEDRKEEEMVSGTQQTEMDEDDAHGQLVMNKEMNPSAAAGKVEKKSSRRQNRRSSHASVAFRPSVFDDDDDESDDDEDDESDEEEEFNPSSLSVLLPSTSPQPSPTKQPRPRFMQATTSISVPVGFKRQRLEEEKRQRSLDQGLKTTQSQSNLEADSPNVDVIDLVSSDIDDDQ